MARILLAGTHSGCGKTTLTLAVLAGLKQKGFQLASFKCGPDFIDPAFHREVGCIDSRNLDAFFCNSDSLRCQISAAEHKVDMVVIEAVMGYYDGIGLEGEGSSYEIAELSRSPVVLVVRARGMMTSAAALIRGFKSFKKESRIRGVIFNGIEAPVYEKLAALAASEGLKSYGYLPLREHLALTERKLGLIPPCEIDDMRERLALLGELACESLDLDGLADLARSAEVLELDCDRVLPTSMEPERLRLAVARDEAFAFLYPENLEILENLGCELCYFSPLYDSKLPEHCQGLYLCGGYQDLHAQALAENTSLKADLLHRIQAGLPTVAEAGGFAYLCQEVAGQPMVGLFDVKITETERLSAFGYLTLEAVEDNLLCRRGEQIRSRDFRYLKGTDEGKSFVALRPGASEGKAQVFSTESYWAGFPPLYFPANPSFAANFVAAMRKFGAGKQKGV